MFYNCLYIFYNPFYILSVANLINRASICNKKKYNTKRIQPVYASNCVELSNRPINNLTILNFVIMIIISMFNRLTQQKLYNFG